VTSTTAQRAVTLTLTAKVPQSIYLTTIVGHFLPLFRHACDRSVGRSFVRLVGRSAGWSVGRSVGRLFGRSVSDASL